VNRPAPQSGEAATWKGLVIIGGAVLLGLAVTRSFGSPTVTPGGAPTGTDASRSKNTATIVTSVPGTTSTSMPLRNPKDVKVVVANATATTGAGKKVVDALKPACYSVQVLVEATAKVKAEKRSTTTVYSTPGYEREAAQLTTRLGLQTTANAALPPEPPVATTKGAPTYNVLVLVGQDLVDTPPQALPPCEGTSTGSSTTTASTRRGATTPTTKSRSSTTAAGATTTKKPTSTTRLTTTTT